MPSPSETAFPFSVVPKFVGESWPLICGGLSGFPQGLTTREDGVGGVSSGRLSAVQEAVLEVMDREAGEQS